MLRREGEFLREIDVRLFKKQTLFIVYLKKSFLLALMKNLSNPWKFSLHKRSFTVENDSSDYYNILHTLLKIKVLYWYWWFHEEPITFCGTFPFPKMLFKWFFHIIKMFFTLIKTVQEHLNKSKLEPKMVLLHRYKTPFKE